MGAINNIRGGYFLSAYFVIRFKLQQTIKVTFSTEYVNRNSLVFRGTEGGENSQSDPIIVMFLDFRLQILIIV